MALFLLRMLLRRRRQCPLDGPSRIESGVKRLARHAKLIGPIRHALSFSIELQKPLTWLMTRTSFRCALNRPPALESFSQGGFVHSESLGQFLEAQHFSLVLYQVIATHVPHLRCSHSPAAIALAVALVVINAFKSMLRRRSWSHVLVERLERSRPFVADRNASSSVTNIACCSWTFASTLDPKPDVVLRALASTMRCTAAGPTFGTGSITQHSPADDTCISTITDTMPEYAFVLRFCDPKNGPATKALPSQVFEVTGAAGRIPRSHSSLLSRFGWLEPAGRVTAPLARFIIPGPLAA